jgi:ribonuclease HI
MAWVKVKFKGKKVWAELGPTGELIVEGGRVPIRYSDKAGSKIYNAGGMSISRLDDEVPKELDAGVSAPEPPRGPGKTTGRGSGFGSAGKRTKAQEEAARQLTADQLANLAEGTHICFTDGACKGNPGPAGSGAVVKLANGEVLEASRFLGIATNNVGELTAIGMALDLLEEAAVGRDEPVVIFTDSSYSRGVLTQNWKAKANKELIQLIKIRLQTWTQLRINWVAGHAGIPENERADVLAGAAVEANL